MRRLLLWLGVIFVAGLLLRLASVGSLLPHDVFSDGLAMTQEVDVMRKDGSGAERPYMGLYPQLLPRLALLAPGEPARASGPLPLEEHLARAARPRRDMRIVLVLVSMLVVPATWLLARRFLDARWALVAAALMATSFLDTWFAPQERPHSALSALSLLVVLHVLAMRRRPSPRTFVFTGLAMALAIGSLQNGVAVLVPFAAGVLLCEATRLRSRILGSAAALVLAALSIPLFYPFLFESRSYAGPGMPEVSGSLLNLSGHEVRLDLFNGRGLRTVLWTLWTYEPLISLLALGGLLALTFRLLRRPTPMGPDRKKDLAVVLAYAVPYLAAISLYQKSGQRFCLPLLPYLAVLAASFLRELSRQAGALLAVPRARWTAGAFLVGVPLAAQALCATKLVAVRAAPDTAAQASAWIREHLEPGADRILLSPRLELPLFQSSDALLRNQGSRDDPLQPWFAYQWKLPPSERGRDGYDFVRLPVREPGWIAELEADPLDRLRSLGCRYAVLEVREGWSWRGFHLLRAAAISDGALLARFDPDGYAPAHRLPIWHQDDALPRDVHWFWRILRARRTGPVIEIYRLERAAPSGPESP